MKYDNQGDSFRLLSRLIWRPKYDRTVNLRQQSCSVARKYLFDVGNQLWLRVAEVSLCSNGDPQTDS